MPLIKSKSKEAFKKNVKAAAEDNDDEVNKQFLLTNSSKVYTHHFDVTLGRDNLATIPDGYQVDNIVDGSITATAVVGLNSYTIQDSVTKI